MKKSKKISALRKKMRELKKALSHRFFVGTTVVGLIVGFITIGIGIIWISGFELPDLSNFEERKVEQSTKIYDRTGEIILYDIHGDIKRTIVPYEEISQYIKDATVSIEDENFYKHNGIMFSAILRAALINLKNGNLLGGQGGSTITQQVIKNALLTTDKKLSRKIKEWVLAPRLEEQLSKDEILGIYLNEVPYGGNIYGVQEASRRFFGKDAQNVTLAEAAYIAALPQAPTYFSPYGNNFDDLTVRKNQVLEKMRKNKYITNDELIAAKAEEVDFQKPDVFGIRAAHFVMYVRELLEKEYGAEAISEGGFDVITTLDWDLQEKAEEIAKRYALENTTKFNAENAAIVALDPRNGEILTMVGSRDYFDKNIDGNYNVATAYRQPGSTFKPIVYAAAFNKGFRPETTVFDLSTEFSTTCSSGGSCYRPVNYDNKYRGPITLRDALAQSVNVPAVKTLYLTGLDAALDLAKQMGISSLEGAKRYGLTLVLGGGEVTPLDLTSAYGVFATEGIKYKQKAILEIRDFQGKVIYDQKMDEDRGQEVLPPQTARLISDVLADNTARTPAFGANSFLNIQGQDMASKTGTTNDYRDAWIIGYTPNIVVTAWAGNNDNSSMVKQVAGFIVAPMWREFVDFALGTRPVESFIAPEGLSEEQQSKPIINGQWQNSQGTHNILHFVNKNNPLGEQPSSPGRDPQYYLWESAVQAWSGGILPTQNEEIVSQVQKIRITNPENGGVYNNSGTIYTTFLIEGIPTRINILINKQVVETYTSNQNQYAFTPQSTKEIQTGINTLTIEAEIDGTEHSSSVLFTIN